MTTITISELRGISPDEMPDFNPFQMLDPDDWKNGLKPYSVLLGAADEAATVSDLNDMVGHVSNIATICGGVGKVTQFLGNVSSEVGSTMGFVIPVAIYNGIKGTFNAISTSSILTKLVEMNPGSTRLTCECHALGMLHSHPVTGETFPSSMVPVQPCGLFQQYAMHKLEARADRGLVTATPVVGVLETVRAMSQWVLKKAAGTLHQHRRMMAINLWSSARQKNTITAGAAAVWRNVEPRWAVSRPSGSVYADLRIDQGDVYLARSTFIQNEWSDILNQGCPMAIGVVHALLGGDTQSVIDREWKHTLVVLGAWDGWKVVENRLKSN